ncbi:Hydroxylase/desaturase asaB [Paramyrothecium foliicola]|nr:Hydroxylase/desaturase asaB [Paramyrothecium foliicola]
MAAVTAFFERTELHQTVKPYSWDGPDGQAFPKANFVMKDLELNLTDIRTVPDFKPTIDHNGFCFLENKSRELPNMTGASDCKPYLEEMSQFFIWRPMFNHAEDIPFAVCDPRTNIDLADVVSVDRITHEAAKEVAYFSWNPAHRWYWMSNQTPDEIVIMTQYDTHPPVGFFNIVPHAAFRNGAARPGCPSRSSVEARFIVLEPAPYQKQGPGPNGPFPDDGRVQPWKDWVTPPEPKPIPAPAANNRPMYF